MGSIKDREAHDYYRHQPIEQSLHGEWYSLCAKAVSSQGRLALSPPVRENLDGKLTALGRRNELHLRSVYRLKAALHGLRCHPLTCTLLKIR